MDLVSVLLCTRGRIDGVDRAIESILANDHENIELLLIDQNDDSAVEDLALRFSKDRRLRYVRTETRGKCRALNLGIELAAGPLIAVTDDDCEVPVDWISSLVKAFAAYPTAALVYCNVSAAPHDVSQGFIPVYERTGEVLLTTMWQKHGAHGIGAGSAFRKSAVLDIGGFDVALGPGGRFRAVDDWDLTIRALLSGRHVLETDATTVLHHGFRSHAEGQKVTRDTWFGIGATYVKPLKAGRWTFLPVLLYDLATLAVWPILRDSVRRRRPFGVGRLVGFARGFLLGLRTPMDRRRLLYEIES